MVVEGMQFERGYYSPYFVTNPETMRCEFENCRLLLVDKKIASAREIISVLEASIKGGYPLLIMAEDVEQEALATLVVNRLRGNLKASRRERPWVQAAGPSLIPSLTPRCRWWPSRPPGSATARASTWRTLPS